MFKKLTFWAAALSLIAAACGGGSDDAADADSATSDPSVTTAAGAAASPTTTSAKAPATTNAPPVQVSGNDYCEQANESNPADGIDFFGTDLEEQVNALLELMDQMEAAAPSEIAADVRVLADTGRSLAEILAEFDYNILAVPPDDPRLLGFDTPELQQAVDNIAAFCGLDLDDVDDTVDGQTGTGGLGGGELPSDFPDGLVPPDLLSVTDNGIAGLLLLSSKPLAEINDFYEDIFGAGADSGENVLYMGSFDGKQWVVSVTADSTGQSLIVLVGF